MPDSLKPTLGAFLLFLLLAAGLWVIEGRTPSNDDIAQDFYKRSVQGVEATRDGCERSNAGVRQPLYDFITAAIVAREADGDTAVADSYRVIRQAQVRAAADVPKSPGSPQVDCQAAFPLPPAP